MVQQAQNELQRLLQASAQALGDTLGASLELLPVEMADNVMLSDLLQETDASSWLIATTGLVWPNTPPEFLAILMPVPQARQLADLVLGGASSPDDLSPLSDLQLGALNEALNQMVLSWPNQLAGNGAYLELESPQVQPLNPAELPDSALTLTLSPVVQASAQFNLTIGGQASPLDMTLFMTEQTSAQLVKSAEAREGQSDPSTEGLDDSASGAMASPTTEPSGAAEKTQTLEELMASMQPSASGGLPVAMAEELEPEGGGVATAVAPVTVQPVKFGAFDDQPSAVGDNNQNLDLVMDIRLNLTVELGRTQLTIKEVLELTRGSVVELERVAGEPVDLYANGKLIAKGEVVVIEDNFGLRITSIVSPAERLKSL